MHVPTSILKRFREAASIKQSVLAERLGVSASVVSRLEKTDTTDEAMARRYLMAIGDDASNDALEFYGRDWRLSDRPSVHHPNRENLWAAEGALQNLAAFEKSDDYDALLSAPLLLIRSNLETSAAFVAKTDHSLAWIGTVGVGKTTALSHLTNLVVEGRNGQQQPVFPASAGRTTISEVVIRMAPAYGIAVEARNPDEVRLLVSEMVRAVADGKGGISTELERAIRNMADIRKRKNAEDIRIQIDPVHAMLAADGATQEDVVQDICTRMRLEERTETQLILSETTEDGLKWLSENITAINFGQDPRFSLPHRVTVLVPKNAVRQSRYDLSIVDTKGIHVTAERADLQALTNDPRTLAVLCCAFNDAPGTDPLKLMKSMGDLGSDALERRRVVILVLPRNDEAMKIIDDGGDPPDSVEHGYAIRAGQIATTLSEAGIVDVPVLFFNAMDGSAPKVWKQLENRVGLVRQHQVERLQRFVALSADLVANADAARIQQARVAIEAEAGAAADKYSPLPAAVRQHHQILVEQLENGHPSSIAAAVARQGTWENFEIHHFIGAGVRADANRRTSDHLVKIAGRIEGLEDRFKSLPEVKGLLETLREDLTTWRQEFLIRASGIGRNTYKPYLDANPELWKELKSRYGGGKGYRDDIASKFKEWFDETLAIDEARQKVDARLADAWNELVISRLRHATEMRES